MSVLGEFSVVIPLVALWVIYCRSGKSDGDSALYRHRLVSRIWNPISHRIFCD